MPRKGALKHKTSVAISEEARTLLAVMAEKSGVSQSAVLELAIRERARRERITLEKIDQTNAGVPLQRGTPMSFAELRGILADSTFTDEEIRAVRAASQAVR